MGEQDERQRFWWLHRNNFFEVQTTSISVLAFINSASTWTEVFFWYLMLGVFAAFTLNNVVGAFMYYNSHPTKSELTISSDASTAHLENFTIVLTLPQNELIAFHPISEFNHENEYYPCSPEYVNQLSGESVYIEYDDRSKAQTDLYYFHGKYDTYPKAWPTNEQWMWAEPSMSPVIGSQAMLSELNAKYSETLKLIWNGNDTELIHSFFNIAKAITQFASLDQFNISNTNYNSTKCATGGSDAFYCSVHPYEHNFLLDTMLREATDDRYLLTSMLDIDSLFKSKRTSAKEFLKSVTPKVFNLAPIHVFDEGAEKFMLFLRDWVLDIDPNAYGATKRKKDQVYMADTQTIEINTIVESKVDQLWIEIELPKQLEKYLFMMRTLYEYGTEIRPKAKEGSLSRVLRPEAHWTDTTEQPYWFKRFDCGRNPTLNPQDPIEALVIEQLMSSYLKDDFENRFIEPVLKYYSTHSFLHLQTESGSIKLEPFNSYKIKMLPTGRIISMVENCTKSSLTFCLDACISDYSLEHCACYEWPMHYIHSNDDVKDVCSKPCPGSQKYKEICVAYCEEQLAHPCDQILYRPSVTKKIPLTINRLTSNNSLFRVHVSIEKVFNYIKTTESYELGFSALAAQLGGLLEFWLGINIIGLIHFVVSLIKQVGHSVRGRKTVPKVITDKPTDKTTEIEKKLLLLTATVAQLQTTVRDGQTKTESRFAIMEANVNRA